MQAEKNGEYGLTLKKAPAYYKDCQGVMKEPRMSWSVQARHLHSSEKQGATGPLQSDQTHLFCFILLYNNQLINYVQIAMQPLARNTHCHRDRWELLAEPWVRPVRIKGQEIQMSSCVSQNRFRTFNL